jgi:hypothetical protein
MNNSESYQLYPQIITGCFTIIGFYKLKQEFIEAAKDELSEFKKLSN